MNIQRAHTVPQNDQAFKVVSQPRCKQTVITHGHSIFHITFYTTHLEKKIRTSVQPEVTCYHDEMWLFFSSSKKVINSAPITYIFILGSQLLFPQVLWSSKHNLINLFSHLCSSFTKSNFIGKFQELIEHKIYWELEAIFVLYVSYFR